MPLEATSNFIKLEICKDKLKLTKSQIRSYLGDQLYQDHFKDHFENFLVNIEGELEVLAHESIHDEELNYTPFQGE